MTRVDYDLIKFGRRNFCAPPFPLPLFWELLHDERSSLRFEGDGPTSVVPVPPKRFRQAASLSAEDGQRSSRTRREETGSRKKLDEVGETDKKWMCRQGDLRWARIQKTRKQPRLILRIAFSLML
ncbi:unnamed protein product [Musa acuminata subsp. malaccensis]|uniref:(wild Malaysian banana) hypothetical protein n=1 Tax=Musa acuminata subsp. malaccensis TaxID=214687 RepID=A0A8D6ZVR1_MUSAM|nr:unnamed protein product [Musa acuminata subsp. malaccensis]